MLSTTLEQGLRAYGIGDKLRGLRLSKKMGLVELGRHTGLSAALLSKVERGRLFPTLPTLLRIALVFGVGLEFFIGGDSKRNAVSVVRRRERQRFPERPGAKDVSFFFESLDFAAVERRLNAYYAEFEPRPRREGAPAPARRRRVPVRPQGPARAARGGRGSPPRRRRLRLLPLDAASQLPASRQQAVLGSRRVRAVTAPRILLTGATGYVGGRLLAALERRGVPVRCFVRRPEALRGRAGALDRDRRGRRSRRPGRGPSPRGDRRRLLPDPLDGRRGLRRARPGGRADLRRGRARGGRAADHLPRRARSERGQPLGAPAQPPGDGRDPAAVGRSRRGAARLDRARLRQPLLRDDPGAGRAPARHDLPALGRGRGPADRRRGRRRVPRRGARSAGRCRADLRDRRPGPRDLRRPDARVRAPARPEAAPDPGAAAHAAALEPLARPGDAGLREGRPKARRQPSQSRRSSAIPRRSRPSRSGRGACAKRSPGPW